MWYHGKVDICEQAGIARYVIVDTRRWRGEDRLRLIAYRLTPDGYELLVPDERGWLRPACALEAELHRLRAEILLASRAQQRRASKKWRALGAEAEACLRLALAVARNQRARWWELRAAVSFVPLLTDSDRAAEARKFLGGVYAEIKEGFDLPDMRAARELPQSL